MGQAGRGPRCGRVGGPGHGRGSPEHPSDPDRVRGRNLLEDRLSERARHAGRGQYRHGPPDLGAGFGPARGRSRVRPGSGPGPAGSGRAAVRITGFGGRARPGQTDLESAFRPAPANAHVRAKGPAGWRTARNRGRRSSRSPGPPAGSARRRAAPARQSGRSGSGPGRSVSGPDPDRQLGQLQSGVAERVGQPPRHSGRGSGSALCAVEHGAAEC